MSDKQLIRADPDSIWREEDIVAEMESREQAAAKKEAEFTALLVKIVGDEVKLTTPVTDRNGLIILKKKWSMLAARLKSGNPDRIVKNTEEEWLALKQFMWGVSHIEVVTTEYNQEQTDLHLQGVLRMLANPDSRFDHDMQVLCACLTVKFEKQNWGVVQKAKKRSMDNKEDNTTPLKTKKSKAGPLDKSKLKPPSVNHPIYGQDGIMKGILWYETGATSATCLDPQYQTKNAREFGNNGLQVGTWFARQLAALRDGAHGERVAGVAGDPEKGAWSVVVSDGGYADIDQDLGDTIIYSAPGAFDTKSKTAELEKYGARCLLKSYETKRAIRVIRGQTKWKNAPVCGYRYDGLYTVEEKGEKKNRDGGVYVWVKLVRMVGQEKINRKIPDRKQRNDEEKVSRGY